MHRLALPARMGSLERFRTFVQDTAEGEGMPFSLLPRLELVLEEVLVNIFSYAYPDGAGEAVVDCGKVPGHRLFRIVIRDSGVAHNPLTTPPPDLDAPMDDRPIGGLGVHLVKQMTSSASYAREDGHNVLTLDFSTQAASA